MRYGPQSTAQPVPGPLPCCCLLFFCGGDSDRMMRASQLYLVEDHQPPLILGTVGWSRADPHLLLVLVSYCRLCEEDVGMYNREDGMLQLGKLNLSVRIHASHTGLQWSGDRIPSTHSISTQPQALAALPSRGTAVLLTAAHSYYRSAYVHFSRALAQYTECDHFQRAVQPWMFHECLSWLSTPPPLQPPAKIPADSSAR